MTLDKALLKARSSAPPASWNRRTNWLTLAGLPMASRPASQPLLTEVLSFSSASWVRVDDANGRTLFNDMGQPGESRVFDGPLPLNVFLGNAPVVKVEFRGQPVDVQPFVRSNNTARFTLPLAN